MINNPLVGAQSLNIQILQYGLVFPKGIYQLRAGQSVRIVPELKGFRPGEAALCLAKNLPPGLRLDHVTCAISGTIAPLSVNKNYTVSISSPHLDTVHLELLLTP